MMRSATVSANPTTYNAMATALAHENKIPIAPPVEQVTMTTHTHVQLQYGA